jgi:hypothetical protein
MGQRASKKTKALTDRICQRIAEGESLRSVCRDKDIPIAPSTFVLWCNEDEALAEQYARAMEARADAMFDEMFEIADDASNDYMLKTYGEDEVEVLNAEHVQRSKLRIDTRKWALARMAPKKYGDKIDHNVSGQIAVISREDEQL